VARRYFNWLRHVIVARRYFNWLRHVIVARRYFNWLRHVIVALPRFYVVGSAGIEPATYRLCFPIRLSPPLSSLWLGLSLYPFGVPAVQSLHLSSEKSEDLARDYHQ